MAEEIPNGSKSNGVAKEDTGKGETKNEDQIIASDSKREASWPAVLFFIHVQALGAYGLTVAILHAKFATVAFSLVLALLGLLGATCGAHRLWAHRTYTANTTLKVVLMLLQTMVGQGPIYDWVLAHRLHHAQFQTEDDPYYSTRTFISAHCTSQMKSLSEKQLALRKEIDMSDIEEDGVVMFQKTFYWLLYLVFFVILPINAPVEYWGESIPVSLFVVGCLRYAIVLHGAWLINSATHIWGLKKGDKYPSDTNMVFVLTKSFWPSYHYMLPWDYQSGEYGTYGSGCSTTFIRIFAALGWASCLKTMDTTAVKQALTVAADTGKPIESCLQEVGKDSQFFLHPEHYLDSSRYT